MPIETGPIMEAAIPPFTSMYGVRNYSLPTQMSVKRMETAARTNTNKALSTSVTRPDHTLYSLPAEYHHVQNVSSVSSDSTDSSPTTTVSTFDSPSMTDPSPSSSPESPSSALPLTPFNKMVATVDRSFHISGASQAASADSLARAVDSARVDLISGGSRNVKNLSLNMNIETRPTTSSGIQESLTSANAFSPVLSPIKTGRRKPSNLSIMTPGSERLSFTGLVPDVPPTPSQRPFLPHFPTSPAPPSLLSPTLAPGGGLQTFLPVFDRSHSRLGSYSSFSNQSGIGSQLHDLKEEDQSQAPLSQETKERGYPNGPIQIYDCGVYLYSEPSREEACRFDTVINVAKEIQCPFNTQQNQGSDDLRLQREEPTDIVEPQTAASEVSFKSAFEWPLSTSHVASTTPKLGDKVVQRSEPEYIHVPWDHNSEIIDDLLPLCQLIDQQVNLRKSVLVHCQLGVSRSASLVLAYGLYKGYESDFHTMYGTVKARSQWISPNMSLIYQLMDFRSKVAKAHFTNARREPPAAWFTLVRNKADPPIAPASTTMPAQEPRTRSFATQTEEMAPESLRNERSVRVLPPVPSFLQSEPQKDPALGAGDGAETISSAESTQTVFPIARSPDLPATQPSKRAIPRPLALREGTSAGYLQDIPPHSPRKEPGTREHTLIISYPKSQMDLAMQDVPDTPSLFSPRQAEFMAVPLRRTLAGDLLSVSERRVQELQPLSLSSGLLSLRTYDPRSPAQKIDSGEIMRNIDAFL